MTSNSSIGFHSSHPAFLGPRYHQCSFVSNFVVGRQQLKPIIKRSDGA